METKAYRSLLLQIAMKLTAEDRRRLEFLYELPEREKERDACDILEELERVNELSCTNLGGLVNALKQLNREDLVNLVDKKLEEQTAITKQKQSQQVLDLKRQMEVSLKSIETLKLTIENIRATIRRAKEEHLFPIEVLKSVETMIGTAHDKNKEARVMMNMASEHLGFKPSKTSATTLVVVGNGKPPINICHKPSTIHKTPPSSPTVRKRMKKGVKRILGINQQATDLRAVVTPPRSRITVLTPPKKDEEETLSSNEEDSLYEKVDSTQMAERQHSLDTKKEGRARKDSLMVFAVPQVPKIIDTPSEEATAPMHAQTQTKSKTADDSDSDRDDDDLEDLGESGYSGSTTGGDSGMEVPLYAIPIIRKQETIPEEEPEYYIPEPRDPVKT